MQMHHITILLKHKNFRDFIFQNKNILTLTLNLIPSAFQVQIETYFRNAHINIKCPKKASKYFPVALTLQISLFARSAYCLQFTGIICSALFQQGFSIRRTVSHLVLVAQCSFARNFHSA